MPILLMFALSTCSDKKQFAPLQYYPIVKNHQWEFTGSLAKLKISEKQTLGDTSFVTLTYFDSLNILLWKEQCIATERQLYWKRFESSSSILPDIEFNPPLPLAPLSLKLGYSETITSVETQFDSLNNNQNIQVRYEIDAIEDIEVPAGYFENCIRLKMSIQYIEPTAKPYFIGEHYWWFARDVGPVKYDTPSANGELVKTNFKLRRLPDRPSALTR